MTAVRALVDNANDPEQVTQGRRSESLQRKDQERRWSEVLGTYPGRAVMTEILEWTGLGSTAFSADVYRMAYDQGKANIGNHLRARIEGISLDLFVQMRKEAVDRHNALTMPKKKRKDDEPSITEDDGN